MQSLQIFQKMVQCKALLKYITKIIEKFPGLNLIASGGVTCENDLNKLKKIGCYGAIGEKLYMKKE